MNLKQFQQEEKKYIESMFIVDNIKFSGLANGKLTPESLISFMQARDRRLIERVIEKVRETKKTAQEMPLTDLESLLLKEI